MVTTWTTKQPFDHLKLYREFLKRETDATGTVVLHHGRIKRPGKHVPEFSTVELKPLVGDYIFGYENETLSEVVGALLREKGATVATAESCTGGNIARLIVEVPGSSDYYLGSILSYANRVKIDHLGVRPEHIDRRGAVSREVVEQMARGVLERMDADFSVATSGIAGPGGGTDEKPVGTTWIAAASKTTTRSKKYRFGLQLSPQIDLAEAIRHP